jgi:hypothetical protein
LWTCFVAFVSPRAVSHAIPVAGAAARDEGDAEGERLGGFHRIPTIAGHRAFLTLPER